MSKVVKTIVSLQSTDSNRKQEFEITQANRLLSLPKSKWKLADSNFKWNGIELAKVEKTKAEKTDTKN